jgi:hypothetical protein
MTGFCTGNTEQIVGAAQQRLRKKSFSSCDKSYLLARG